ncbi:DUF1178 family protein [Afifella pfennigii]|uniref:DUF1178 family protein n=1 Tax=Afifella pfennigii TaxID=209897 RepID=UPI000479B671|nr:DUF1178 family protein [Afifella pfennigii]
MIHYTLRCEDGHAFDGWFASSAAFDAQKAQGQLACPICGSASVDKALMAPAVASSETVRQIDQETPQSATATAPREAKEPMASAPALPAAVPPQLVEAIREIRRHVRANAEYVGDKFPEEARKIHYAEADRRGIYGEATREEVKALSEEGIEFHPLPLLPEDFN